MNVKKIFVDVVSFLGTDKQNPIGCVFQEIARKAGEVCSSAKDADIVVVGNSQSAMTALSASDTNRIVLVAVTERWKDELTVGANLLKSFPDRFAMYGLLPMPEMAIEGAEDFFASLN